MSFILDLGPVLSLTNATSAIPAGLGGGTYPALSTGYNTGASTFATFGASRARGIALVADFTLSAATDLRVKLQGTRDGVKWFDLQVIRQDTGAAGAEVVVTASGTVALETASQWLVGVQGYRVIGRSTGAPGASDAIAVAVVAGA